jgi:hypothetical protein
MVQVATIFRGVLDGTLDTEAALASLQQIPIDAPFSNGFHHGRPGYGWTTPASAVTH